MHQVNQVVRVKRVRGRRLVEANYNVEVSDVHLVNGERSVEGSETCGSVGVWGYGVE